MNIDRDTPMLLPVDLREWVADNDLAHLILEAVEMGDTRGARINVRGTGSRQYPPTMMLALLIYSYATGLFSSRRIERASHDSLAVRYLCGNTHPDHDTIATFRRENGELFQRCFAQVLLLAREAGVLQVGTISIDGSRLAGAGSRRTVRTLGEIEAELELLGKQLAGQAEETDLLEESRPETALPVELAGVAQRRGKLLAAQARIQARRQEAVEAGRRDGPQSGRRTSVASLSEPQSRRLSRGPGTPAIQGYNVQMAADAGQSGLILGCTLSDAATDTHQLLPVLDAVPPEAGRPQVVLVDKGYDHAGQIATAEIRHVVTVLCPPQNRSNVKPGRHRKGREARIWQQRQQMRDRMQEPHWARLFERRKTTAEGVFARIKQNLGFTRFRCWGQVGAAAEWSLICLAHNLRILTGKRLTN